MESDDSRFMTARIIPMQSRHVRGFHEALDSVAREGRFIAMIEAPPLAAARRFVRNGAAAGSVQLVALVHEAVVGWCDISRFAWLTQRHPDWKGLRCVVMVVARRETAKGEERERRFYISSLPADADTLAAAIRAH